MKHKNIFARNTIAIAVALSLTGCATVATPVRGPAPEVYAAADLPPPMESIPQRANVPIVEQSPERVAVLPSPSAAPAASSGPSYNFGYSVRRAEATGVMTVFDDGYQTYLQFAAPPAADAQAFDAQGTPLIAARHGDYMVIAGVHSSVLVQSGWLYSHVSAGPLDMRAGTQLPHGAARLAAAPAQSDAARAQPADAPLKATEPQPIARAIAAPEPMASVKRVALERVSKEAEKDESRSHGANAKLIRVHFPKGATRLNVSKQTRNALVRAAMQSKRIILNGEAGGATANMTLARARALSAKRMLVGEGVAASKIIVSYSAATGGVGLNNTKDGRASERRVDFVFVGPGEERIQVAHSDGNVARTE